MPVRRQSRAHAWYERHVRTASECSIKLWSYEFRRRVLRMLCSTLEPSNSRCAMSNSPRIDVIYAQGISTSEPIKHHIICTCMWRLIIRCLFCIFIQGIVYFRHVVCALVTRVHTAGASCYMHTMYTCMLQQNYNGNYNNLCTALICLSSTVSGTGQISWTTHQAADRVICDNGKVSREHASLQCDEYASGEKFVFMQRSCDILAQHLCLIFKISTSVALSIQHMVHNNSLSCLVVLEW